MASMAWCLPSHLKPGMMGKGADHKALVVENAAAQAVAMPRAAGPGKRKMEMQGLRMTSRQGRSGNQQSWKMETNRRRRAPVLSSALSLWLAPCGSGS